MSADVQGAVERGRANLAWVARKGPRPSEPFTPDDLGIILTALKEAEERIGTLEQAVRLSTARFRDYEQQHRAKGTLDADWKAEANRQMAVMCDAALTGGSNAR